MRPPCPNPLPGIATLLLATALLQACRPIPSPDNGLPTPTATPTATTEPRDPADPRPRVVASFFPLFDFARVLAGDDLLVSCLVPPGADPHAIEPTPAMARAVAEAHLVLLLGLHLDGWVSRLAHAESRAAILVASEGIDPLPASAIHSQDPQDPHDSHDHPPGPASSDPHLWLDPLRARLLVRNIALAMIRCAPGAVARIEARHRAYDSELLQLHEAFESTLGPLPRRQVVTDHNAFAYLFSRYHLESVGTLHSFPGHEPSAADLRLLVERMRALGIDTLFTEPQIPDRVARVIAQEIGGHVDRLDPCETILPDAPLATYLDRQRQNLTALQRALSRQP